eukprot:2943721-Amphidinium_carterae.1
MPNPDADLPFATITDRFLGSVHSGRVRVQASAVTAFDHGEVIFSDGHRQSFDAVVFATGYR